MIATLLISTTSFADSMDNNFQERLLERYNHTFDEVSILDVHSEGELLTLQNSEYEALIEFANSLGLQRLGFSYEMYEAITQININGEAKYFVFAIDILKDNKKMTRRYYEVSIRVDGILYISRIVNADY